MTDKNGAHRLLTYLEDEYGVALDETAEATGTTKLDLVIDIGNSETYALGVVGAVMGKPLRLPSIKSVRGANAAALLSGRGRAGDWRALAADEHVVTTKGVDRFVGQLAIRSATFPTSARGSEERYSDGWNLDFLYAAVGKLTGNSDRVQARIITGLPFDLWGGFQGVVKAALKGAHEFQYNGVSKRLTVTSVEVEREGHSAWWALPAAWKTGLVLVLDWGGHTCNILLIAPDGTVVNGTTQPVGMETILDDISAATPRPLSIPERMAVQAAIRDEADAFVIPFGSDMIDVLPIARRYITDAVRTFAQKLKATIPQQQRSMIATVALVGGTAYAVAEELRKEIPVLKTLTREHEFANLVGNAAKHGLIEAKAKGGR